MRLLHLGDDGKIRFESWSIAWQQTRYAILSHTWSLNDQDEVTHQDILDGTEQSKSGYAKIAFCAQQAKRDGLAYFWIDTCCIDKSSLTELSESLTMMYRWYGSAAKCYVYLSDVDCHAKNASWLLPFRMSRWFTRGWTLQELLAPAKVEFYSRQGDQLGDRISLSLIISDITGIDVQALNGGREIHSFSEEERFKWASRRQTKRAEDRAYSLLGIFDVSMLPNYGEGENSARRRLLKKINERHQEMLNQLGRQIEEAAMASRITDQPVVQLEDGVLVHQGQEERQDQIAEDQRIASKKAKELLERQLKARARVIDRLRFDSMNARRISIRTALDKTCGWLLQHPAYLSWLDRSQLEQHHGFMWVKGTPGAGKSTLMKYIDVQTEKRKSKDDISISFYFNARGKDIDHSIQGLYRTLLVQLFEAAPYLQRVLDHDDPQILSEIDFLTDIGDEEMLARLQTTLSEAILGLKDNQLLYCFIDALDECPVDEVQQLIIYFETIGRLAMEKKRKLHVCFASRHYPTIVVEAGVELILEHEAGHEEDLRKYVQKHIRVGQHTASVESAILNKANGIFMWVVLVVGILNDEFRRGRLFAVEKRLREVPVQLSALFQDILQRDKGDITEFQLCLSWLLFSRRPLTIQEYYYGMAIGLQDDPTVTDADSCGVLDLEDAVPRQDMLRYLHHSSKGLAETTRGTTKTDKDDANHSKKPNVVQFIHESVRDFLLKDNGLANLWPGKSGEELESACHDMIKACCYKMILAQHVRSSTQHIPVATSQPQIQEVDVDDSAMPWMYACSHVLTHADHAAKKTSQAAFLLDQFDIGVWWETSTKPIGLSHVMEKTNTKIGKLLYWFALEGLVHLIDELRRLGHDMSPQVAIGNGATSFPLFAALSHSNKAAVYAILRCGGQPDKTEVIEELPLGSYFSPQDGVHRTPLIWALHVSEAVALAVLPSTAKLDAVRVVWLGLDALALATMRNYVKVVTAILSRSRLLIHGRDSNGWTLLMQAALYDATATAKVILDAGAFVDAEDPYGNTALHTAMRSNNFEVVRLLIERRASINKPNMNGESCLFDAVKQSNHAAIEFLIENGADVNFENREKHTPLWAAMERNSPESVSLLLNHGADANSKDTEQRTVLWAALSLADPKNWQHWRHDMRELLLTSAASAAQSMLRLLIAAGLDLEARDASNKTVLMAAVDRPMDLGMTIVIKSLLVVGAQADARDATGNTPLMAAAKDNKTDVLRILVEHGASLNAGNDADKTALHVALNTGSKEAVATLTWLLEQQSRQLTGLDSSTST